MTMNKRQLQPTHPSSSKAGSEAPSDIELMQYFDSELEEPRRSVVAAFVGADARANNKLAAMSITSAIVRNEAESLFPHRGQGPALALRSHPPSHPADSIADLVMAKIAASAPPQVAPVHPAQAVAFPTMGAALGQAELLPNTPGATMGAALAPRQARSAANDNGRRILGAIAALAVAAAAGLAIWSRFGTDPAAPTRNMPIASHTSPSTLPSLRSTEPELDAAAVTAEADTEHGVEVAAVNFGAHTGSIFFVPSGSIEAKRTTTVVWLADDAGE